MLPTGNHRIAYPIISFLFLVAISSVFSSCKKGCTNRDALNYDASAKEDDAGCRFCNIAVIDTGSQTQFTQDPRPQSFYYASIVLMTSTSSVLSHYQGNGCPLPQAAGACSNGSSVQDFKFVDLTLRNMIADTITLNALVHLYDTNPDFYFDSTLVDIEIPPNSAVTVYKRVVLSCASAVNSSAFVQFDNLSFSYR